MKKLLVLAMLALATSAARADSVDDIVAKNARARGGDFSVEVELGMLQKRPSMLRFEGTLQGLTQIQAYDGKDGWQVQPFQGRRDPERMAADDAKDLAQRADIDPPLVAARNNGYKIEALGTEDIDGTQAVKMRITRKDGDVQYVYLDPDSMLEIRVVTINRVRGVETVNEADLGSYAQVGGVWFPMTIEAGEKGKPRAAKITIERIEINPAADDALFHFPAAGTKVARVAGVPRPFSIIASRNSSSSTNLPAPSIAESSVASV